jgi:SPP1 family predicted phage head-tail adaptor
VRIPAGQLTERVTLQQVSETTPPGGARQASWADVVTVWAKVEPLDGQADEALRASAVTASVRYRVSIRYRDGVTAKLRLLWRPFQATASRVLQVQAVSLVGRQWVVLDCFEGTT